MDYEFHKRLRLSLVSFYRLHLENGYDRKKYELRISELRRAKHELVENGSRWERDILLYSLETLFKILDENDKTKVRDFVFAIMHAPEIFMKTRNMFSLRYDIMNFRFKYGEQFFPFITRLKPFFNKKAPKNTVEYFSRHSDTDFKMLHPVAYPVLSLLGVILLFLPTVLLFACFFYFKLLSEDSWQVIIGLVGSFLIGVGFFNIVSAWLHQHLGHFLTFITLFGGGCIVGLSFLLLLI